MEPLSFLVRHAAAESASPSGDQGRRLTAQGIREFEARLRAPQLSVRISRICASPYVRAQETAAILGERFGATVELEPSLAAGRSTGSDILQLLQQRGQGIAYVGHNPEMAEALALAAGRVIPAPPGTLAAVYLDGRGLAWVI